MRGASGTVEDLFAELGLLESPPIKSEAEEYFDCGHFHRWWSATDHELARAEGFCCMGGKKRFQPSWRHVRGKPLPPHARRTTESMGRPGFTGFCVNPEGSYIGGLGNDCRYYRPPGASVCEAHHPAKRDRGHEEAFEEGDFESVGEPTPEAPEVVEAPKVKSHKQKQIEARKRAKSG